MQNHLLRAMCVMRNDECEVKTKVCVNRNDGSVVRMCVREVIYT